MFFWLLNMKYFWILGQSKAGILVLKMCKQVINRSNHSFVACRVEYFLQSFNLSVLQQLRFHLDRNLTFSFLVKKVSVDADCQN